jgi:hypothetical protein
MKGTGMKLFIYQNLNTFSSPVPFSLDLYIREPFPWSHHLYTVIGIAALLGFILGILAMLKPYRNTRRRLLSARQEKQPTTEMTAQPPTGSAADPQAALPQQEKSDPAGPE